MASLYTRAADGARLAKGAMAKLDRTPDGRSRTLSKGAAATAKR